MAEGLFTFGRPIPLVIFACQVVQQSLSQSDHCVVVEVVELRVVRSRSRDLGGLRVRSVDSGSRVTSHDSFRAGDLGEVLGFRAGWCV